MAERFSNLPWKDIVRQVDQGIDHMIHYCEENQDWLKAVEANKLLQAKHSKIAELLAKYAAFSAEASQPVLISPGLKAFDVLGTFPSPPQLPNQKVW